MDAKPAKSPDDIGEEQDEYQALGYLPSPLAVGEEKYREERKKLVGTAAEIKNDFGHKGLADATMPERPKYHMNPA